MSSAEAVNGEFVSLTSRLRDELIAMGRLTPEGATRIDEAMRAMGLGFGEAAIHLGLLTSDELAGATQAARQRPADAQSDGIIEGALHKLSSAHNLPVKYVRMVKAGPSLILAHDADSAYCERIRALRTELLLLNGSANRGTAIAILSPCRGEGRTQLSAELAIAFSQLGRRTLLVDADLRSPRVHTLFESENMVGLGQALASRGAPLLCAVEKLPFLSVLIAGPSVPNPLELLTNGHFQQQIADWRKRYGVVIIDTPPVSEYADGLAIASLAEQVLVVGRSDSTPHRHMKEMLRRMAGSQSRIVGAVINSF